MVGAIETAGEVGSPSESLKVLVELLEGEGLPVADYHVEQESSEHIRPSAILLHGLETDARPALRKLDRAPRIATELGYPLNTTFIRDASAEEAGNCVLVFEPISSERGKTCWGT